MIVGCCPNQCYQHYRRREDELPLYENVTRRVQFNGTNPATVVEPYERPFDHTADVGSCTPAAIACPGSPTDTRNCGYPYWNTCQADGLDTSHRVTRGNFYNDFRLVSPASNASFSACYKSGFKNLFSKKEWHGRPGYQDTDQTNIHGANPDHFAWCGYCPVQDFKPDAPTTMYRTMGGSPGEALLAAVGTDNVADGDTVTCGGVTYTFRTSLTGHTSTDTTVDVMIGADILTSISNFIDAVNGVAIDVKTGRPVLTDDATYRNPLYVAAAATSGGLPAARITPKSDASSDSLSKTSSVLTDWSMASNPYARAHYEETFMMDDGHGGSFAVTYHGDAAASASVDRHTGELSGHAEQSCDDSAGGPFSITPGYYAAMAMSQFEAGANNNVGSVYQFFTDNVTRIRGSVGSDALNVDPDVKTGSGNTWTLQWHKPHDDDYWPDALIHEIGIVGGTFAYKDDYGPVMTGPTTSEWDQIGHYELSYSETHYHCSFWGQGETVGFNGTVSGYCEVELSDPYTYSNLCGDVDTLRQVWDLGDDVKYPFRTDGNTTYGPLATYDETYNALVLPPPCASSLIFPSVMSCDTVAPGYYSGQIVGAPHDKYGARFWDDRFELWRVSVDDGAGCTGAGTIYLEGYGSFSSLGSGSLVNLRGVPVVGIPWSATQWTNALESDPTSPSRVWTAGQHMHMEPGGHTLYASDWVEIKNHRPAINWARPCGKDRWALQPRQSWCIRSISSGTITFESGDTHTIADSDLVAVYGTGICHLHQTGADTATIIDTVATQALLDAQGASPWYGASSPMAMIVRWPTTPAICSTLKIQSITTASPAVCTVLGKTFLITGDSVVVAGVDGLNATWTVLIADDAHPENVTLVGSDYTDTYAGGGTMSSPGQCAASWDTEKSKWSFVLHKFTTNSRDIGEYDRLTDLKARFIDGTYVDCTFSGGLPCDGGSVSVPDMDPRTNQWSHGMNRNIISAVHDEHTSDFNACCPPIIAMVRSASDHHFPKSARVYEFPASAFVCDRQYGSWQASFVESEMTDPLWSPPSCPCMHYTGTDVIPADVYECDPHVTWVPDDGGCHTDVDPVYDPDSGWTWGAGYYPADHLVEAVNAKPSGAKALPSDVKLACATQTQANQTTLPAGLRVCNYWPAGFQGQRPWGLWNAEETCVCSGRRFSAYYVTDGVVCVTSEIDV